MRLRFFSLLAFALIWGCQSDDSQTDEAVKTYQKLQGRTMGTTYGVSYRDSLGRNFQAALDSILLAVNQEVSTYIEDSDISTFNKGGSLSLTKDKAHFLRNFRKSKTIYSQTKGWFNPAVMPLVNYWGFGYTEKKAVEQVDSSLVDSLVGLVAFDSIRLEPNGENWTVLKTQPAMQLDFSAIAKGDAVDVLGRFLEAQGIKDYLVEIGGEVRARGMTNKGFVWRAGINVPSSDAAVGDLQAAVELDDCALATSGNYRNFYEVNGQKYAHTINPNTGYPEKNRLLSASVIAKDCATADAFATAFMAMGLDAALSLAEQLEGVDAYFIFSDELGDFQTKVTKGFEEALLD